MFKVQDVIDRQGDITSNYSLGQSDLSQRLRGIDNAVNYIKRRIGNIFDEYIYTFLYSEDVLYYDMPADFREFISLTYANQVNNKGGVDWDYRPYPELLSRLGTYPNKNNVSEIGFNGKHQLLMFGTNLYRGGIVESFDTAVWAASGDASGASTDTAVFIQGSGSEKFTLTYGTGTGTLSSPTIVDNVAQFHKQNGQYRLRTLMPSAPTNVQFIYGTDSSNYYTITATTQANGTAFSTSDWNLISFPSTSKVMTGSPVDTNITFQKIVFTIPAGFSAVMHVDNLYTAYPDLMQLVYYTNIKGVDINGTPISKITDVTDTINYDDDYIEPIALKAAGFIYPQLSADPAFISLAKSELNEWLAVEARTNPKKRAANNAPRTVLRRN